MKRLILCRFLLLLFILGGGLNPNVLAQVAPTITSFPDSQAIDPGDSVNLTVTATGTGPLSYQWYLNGEPVSGATTATYSIASATDADLGSYSVEVRNSAGVVPAARAAIVAAGSAHSLFVDDEGTLWTMGYGENGQLGDGTTMNHLSPVAVATDVVAVAASGNHSLFLKSDGTAWAMGNNLDGQLGTGNTQQVLTPIQIGSGVAAVAAGGHHGFLLHTDGTLWAMGDNTFGQLGDGTTTARLLPVQVATGVTAIATGEEHSLYLKTDGTVWGMGRNSWGQLGDGTFQSRQIPVQMGVDGATVAAGSLQSLFVKTDGSLWVTGVNSYGQLGNGTETNLKFPTQVNSGVGMAASGRDHTVVSKIDGTLWSMGYNDSGQLGDGTTMKSSVPVPIVKGAIAAAVGYSHSFILLADGTLLAMGNNAVGQLGDPDDLEDHTLPVAVSSNLPRAALISFRSVPVIVRDPQDRLAYKDEDQTLDVIAIGGDLSFQWRKDGIDIPGATGASYTVHAAQDSDEGNYDVVVSNGLGSATSAPAALTVGIGHPFVITQPVSQSVDGGDSVIIEVVASGGDLSYQWSRNDLDIPGANAATYVIPSASLADVGTYRVTVSNAMGSIWSLTATLEVTVYPPGLTSGPETQALDAGGNLELSTTVTGTNPISYQWYKNGQLIAGATGATYSIGSASSADIGQYSVTISNEFGRIGAVGPWLIGSGGVHSMYLKADGSLWLAGNNEDGQLGVGTDEAYRPSFTNIADDAVAVAAGWFHSLFLKSDGSLWGMGDGGEGQLGTSGQVDHDTPIKLSDGVQAMAAGAIHTLILKTDGTLWATGNNQLGQLGDGTFQNRLWFVQVASDVRAIAAGGLHSLFVKNDGTLWAMGNNDHGQLGDGTNTDREVPVQVASNVRQISAGFRFSLFVKNDGTLWAMGENADGQLGDGSNVDRNTPVGVADRVSSASAGAFHSMILRNDGSLWVAGWNEYGQLGDGTGTSRNRFMQVSEGVGAIGAGLGFSLFTKTDGTLWGMGDNLYGQLGIGNQIDQYLPVLVESGLPRSAQVTVTDPDAKLLGLSTRGFVGSGDNLMIMGFVVDGGSPKQIIVRGLGPTLAGYGVAGTIANPTLELYHDGAVIASNDDWENLPDNVELMNSVGLQAPSSPLESVIIQTLAPGAYTAQLRGVGSGTGVGLLEIYDGDPGSADPNSKLYAISTRGFMQSGDGVLIGGFVVSGEAPKQVLVQAVGPSLSAYFPGFLADPAARLERFIGGSSLVVAENDDWETGNDRNMMMGARMRSGATPLTDGAKDASMLLWIEPGIYTAVSYGADGGTGVALMNIYEVPPE